MILKKVRGEVNPADLLTKHISVKDKIEQLVELYGLVFLKGRARTQEEDADAQQLRGLWGRRVGSVCFA